MRGAYEIALSKALSLLRIRWAKSLKSIVSLRRFESRTAVRRQTSQIDGNNLEAQSSDLMVEAEDACMAHFALRNPITWGSRLLHNGKGLMDHAG